MIACLLAFILTFGLVRNIVSGKAEELSHRIRSNILRDGRLERMTEDVFEMETSEVEIYAREGFTLKHLIRLSPL